MIEVENVSNSFVPHTQGAARNPILSGVSLRVAAGECVALDSASRSVKSTLMRMIYGNYLAQGGAIRVGGTDLVRALPRKLVRLRRERPAYVSQFLRVVPRVPARDVVAGPLRALGRPAPEALAGAEALLVRHGIPQTLWALSPTTFSGGKQQRVNIARGFVRAFPAPILDDPTANLGPDNRETVLRLMEKAKARGAPIVGIFRGAEVRKRDCDREIDVGRFAPGAAT